MNLFRYVGNKIIKKSVRTIRFTLIRAMTTKGDIGDFTYGSPKIFSKNDFTNLFIGKYCSTAGDVVILVGF